MDETIHTVTELTGHIKEVVEGAFFDVWVTGEVVGFKHHGSGHLYFTLKDDRARLNAVIFRGQLRFLAMRPEEIFNGSQLVCHGRLNVYEPHGAYSLIIDQVRPAGRGQLLQQLEEVKARLAAEGLFDESRKRKLPYLPGVIGIVTSETSAAIRDMLRVIEGRFPSRVKLCPANVQGPGAVAQIVKGIRRLDQDEAVDVIIVGRGGGAFEDLLPFSDEQVVRAVAECETPIVSAVGHEIDFPLCDLAADVRAPTPTGAAQIVVPELASLRQRLEESERRLLLLAQRLLTDSELRLADCNATLGDLADLQFSRLEAALQGVKAGLASAHPAARLERLGGSFVAAREGLERGMDRYLELAATRLARAGELLEQMGPAAQFRRGYAIVRDAASGRAVRSCREAAPGQDVDIILQDGTLESTIVGPKPQAR